MKWVNNYYNRTGQDDKDLNIQRHCICEEERGIELRDF